MIWSRNSFLAAALLCAINIIGTGISAQAASPDSQAPRYQMRPGSQSPTPDQRMQAQRIYDDTLAATNETRQSLNVKRYQLDQELASPNPDSSRIEALSREIGELRGKLLAARAEARARLAQQGLPPDGFGNYYNDNRASNGWQQGWGREYHHGRRHGHPRGCPGYWNGYGMGMMY